MTVGNRPDEPITVGLTGPIGCGKSTVAAMLAELGGAVIDADALARAATAPGEPALSAIGERFGAGVFDATGSLDRPALAAIVFEDADALRDLEAIVHPRVRVLVERALDEARVEAAPFVVIEAIKLVEGGLADRCDEVWLVECSLVAQRERLAGRGMSPADVERRMAAQGTDLAERLAPRADRRIETTDDVKSVRERVMDALAEVLVSRFGGLPMGPADGPPGSR